MKPVVRIENVGKRYRLGALHPGYMTFRELVGGVVTAPFRRRRRAEDESRTFWALRGVSFDVGRGELVGVIGRNGAGKSTLLKILSRVTRPTTGEVELRGRVGSLLEVGTGFHPDLTGRENIYLSGAILGMRRAEIARKFDEIVAFSELEKFIDTSVKFFSSGMYVRLAFSVAAHLEPEILIMDEVLAVGDAAFQLKCLDKMRDVRQQGRTVFFVSHNMAAVTRLCRRAVLLEGGRLVADGDAREVVDRYLSDGWQAGALREWGDEREAPGDSSARLRSVRVCDEAGRTTAAADIHRPVLVEVTYDVVEGGRVLAPVVELANEEGTLVFSTQDTAAEWRGRERPAGRYTSAVTIPGNLLAEGSLVAHVSLVSHQPTAVLHAHATNAVAFQVIDREGGDYAGPLPGVVRPLLEWATRREAGG